MPVKRQRQKTQKPIYTGAEALSALAKVLPDWYLKNCRSLPWRGTGNPYDVWLSEIMLQQTRVEAVKAYFVRFKAELPTIGALAACPEERLLKLWEGLGYYSRVRNLQKAARILTEQYGGVLPREKAALLKLPGIGSYTAGAIASIAYGMPEPAVDGNVLRVCARAAGNEQDIALPETKAALEAAIQTILIQNREFLDPAVFNQALMELGAIVCLPNGQPNCLLCPVRAHCAAYQQGRIEMLPVKQPKKARRIEQRTVFLIQNGENFLIQKRPARGLLAGLWELPNLGGALTEKEALKAVREMGLSPLRIEPLPAAKHIFTHVEWHMTGYRFRLPADTKSNAVFADEDELRGTYALPSAFEAYLRFARGEKTPLS